MPGHLIRRLHQIATHVFSAHAQRAGHDLTPVQFAAMDAIGANPGVDQARIAALIAYDRATIGGVIDRLEKKGLVVRKVSQRDRRAREVFLSTEGRKMVDDVFPIVREMQTDILRGLSDEERETFLSLATKATNAHRED
ncbi:MarR family winged helix-turn-helix transcriptional regulator [Shimia aestuarii]|uniref:MarR family winged helix-turn-helix transcriptional regulator n=1 Tax=Shimia aestuarii TaxID=254406 RepID=UPI003260EFFC